MEPEIIYEDKNMLGINKPAGLVVNRSDTTRNVETLQGWVEGKFGIHSPESKNGEREKYQIGEYNKLDEFINRSGIVHRLDKETSGVILIAKNADTFINLQGQFKSGKVKKMYIALAHGKVNPEEGRIEASIGRLPWNRTRFGILPEGRNAVTEYKTVAYKEFNGEVLTLLEVYPKTGRTHQIRVHLRHIGYPIFGDELYAGRKQGKSDRKILPRHFLHASKISLLNPDSQIELEINAPLPADLSSFLEKTQPLID